jgi:hypothetical protein
MMMINIDTINRLDYSKVKLVIGSNDTIEIKIDGKPYVLFRKSTTPIDDRNILNQYYKLYGSVFSFNKEPLDFNKLKKLCDNSREYDVIHGIAGGKSRRRRRCNNKRKSNKRRKLFRRSKSYFL